MNNFLKVIFLSAAFLTTPLLAQPSPGEAKGEELCLFVEDVFKALSQIKGKNQIESYEQSGDPIIQSLAEKFVASFKEGAAPEDLQSAVSELGRLIKCSVDESYRLPYTMHKKDLKEKRISMEKVLKISFPENSNYHKLMMESLAEKKWDVALYAYLKIAEDRCLD